MSNELGFGVIGLGMGMGRAKTYHGAEGAKVVAVSDLIEERRNRAVAELGCDAYENYKELLDRDDIDVAVIMLPSGMHADFGIEAAEKGKHVITTKPMDVRVEKCDALIEACKKNNVKLMVDFGERYRDVNRKIKKAIDMGALGKVILGEFRLKWYRAESYYEGWHGTWKLDGGGSIMNQGVHQLDLLQWFLGPVESARGNFGIYAHKNVETEDLTMAWLKFKSGAVGNIVTTTTYPKKSVTMVHIHGTKGVVGTGPDIWEFVDEPPEIELPPFPKNIAEDAVNVIRNGAEPAVSGEEGRKSVQIINAIYESARTGKEIELKTSK